jgi:prevent-host-death family protein
MQSWQMQAAKANFSDLVQRSQSDGPQEITVHGRPVAVVLSREMFDRLSGNDDNLVDFMRQSPLLGLEDVKIERDRSTTRKTKF